MPTDAKSQPLISVIVPTYNYGRYIGETLESLRAQTYAAWECIVVDDGSTDDTGEVVARYAGREPRVRYVRQENQRQAAARNNGIRHARGQYIQFLDADDLLEPEKFARQVALLEARPDVDIVYSNVRYFNAGQPRVMRRANASDDPWMPEISGAGTPMLAALVRNNIMPVNSPLLRRLTIEEVGDFAEMLTPVEDWEYLIRCAAAGKNFYYDDAEGTRALVRSHPESSSSDSRRMIRAQILMRRTIEPILQDRGVSQLNRERLAEITGLLGVEEFMHGERVRAAAQFVKACLMDDRVRFRFRWALCTAVAPFASRRRMRKLVETSLSGSVAQSLRRA
jgi:glycosyltransferase involved in cell wall biosynthesis